MAALLASAVAELRLARLPGSFRDGPDYLNVLRVFEVPQTVAVAAERMQVRLVEPRAGDWTYPAQVAVRLGWGEDRVSVDAKPAASDSN